MSELKPMEVIMRIDFVASDGKQICAHAEKVQELIRCRECKHMQEDKIFRQCWCNGNEVKPNHFCGYAEREDNG